MNDAMGLLEKSKSKKAGAGIIGPGYAGLPLAVGFCRAGFRVSGFDTDKDKTSLLEQGKGCISYIEDSYVARCGPLLRPTSDFSALPDIDCAIICLPSPVFNQSNRPGGAFRYHRPASSPGGLLTST